MFYFGLHTTYSLVLRLYMYLYFKYYLCACFASLLCFFFFFKQKTAYELRISDGSSDVCSSDLPVYVRGARVPRTGVPPIPRHRRARPASPPRRRHPVPPRSVPAVPAGPARHRTATVRGRRLPRGRAD